MLERAADCVKIALSDDIDSTPRTSIPEAKAIDMAQGLSPVLSSALKPFYQWK